MSNCCEAKSKELDQLRLKQKNVLIAVLVINLLMFFLEFTFGVLAKSTALLADSLDMLGDSMVYAFSLYVINKDMKWKAKASLLKGVIITFFGFYVFGEAVYKTLIDITPVAKTMGIIGGIALFANGICLFLLLKHRDDDINMKSVWICSRNDIIANVGVLIAALCVSIFNSKWPDIIIGLLTAVVFLKSAYSILKESIEQYRLAS